MIRLWISAMIRSKRALHVKHHTFHHKREKTPSVRWQTGPIRRECEVC
jgi:hypothetical protein